MALLETVLALVGGAVSGGGTVGAIALKARGSREARFEKRIDDRLKELETEVEACRNERPQMLLVTMSLKMVVTELQRLDGRNVVLQQVATALGSLPTDNANFIELLAQIDQAIPDYQPPLHDNPRDAR